jgi:hypothetical protein
MTDKKMELLMEENIPREPTYPAWVMEVGEVDAEAFKKAKALHNRAMTDEKFSSHIEYAPDEQHGDLLEDAFLWVNSDEGVDYWMSIYLKIEEQCK